MSKGIFAAFIFMILFTFISCSRGLKDSGNNYETPSADSETELELGNDMHSYQRAFAKAEERLSEAWDKMSSSSILLVMENGNIIYEQGFGYIDKEKKEFWKAENITNIGSVSKLFVTAAILNLDQEKLVFLDSPIIEYLPEFKMKDERYRSITVRMLLNHSSGLPGTKYDDSFLYESDNNQYYQQLMEDLMNEILKSNPGEYPVYCNEGFILAQEIVKRVSGMDYEGYINTKILAPMNISPIFISANPDIKDSFVKITDPMGYGYPREVVIEALAGTGGLAMDAATLALFGDKILSPQISVLDTEHIALFSENQSMYSVLEESTVFNGLGWDYIGYPFGNLPVYSKNGGTINYLSQIVIAPESNLVVVGYSTNPGPIGDVVEQLVMDLLILKGDLKRMEKMPELSEATVPEELLYKSGKYSIIGGAMAFDVTISDNQLVFPMVPLSKIGNEAGHIPYIYMSDGTFSSPLSNEKYEKFSFETINGNDFIMRHFQSDYINYKVAYAQKVETQDSSFGWEGLNGTIWLKLDANVSTMSGMQDLITPLTIDPNTAGFAAFVRQTPFKIVSSSLAVSVNETARDSGNLIIKDESTLSFRESDYIRADKAEMFCMEVLEDIIERGAGKTNWLFCAEEIEINAAAVYPKVRMIIFDENLLPVFDNIVGSKEEAVKIPANSYIMVAKR